MAPQIQLSLTVSNSNLNIDNQPHILWITKSKWDLHLCKIKILMSLNVIWYDFTYYFIISQSNTIEEYFMIVFN